MKIKQNDKTIIIVKEKKSGCGGGCLLLLLLVGGVVALVYPSVKRAGEIADRARADLEAREAAMTPEEKSARKVAKPIHDIVKLHFAQALRDNLREPDSYKPGSYRYHDHPQGYAYFHDYRAKNGFGGYTQEVCGMLCATNTGERVWTFYDRDALPDLLKDCGIN